MSGLNPAFRIARFGLSVIRRYGLLPRGIADRWGDDDRLAGTAFGETVMVYFPGTREDVYQLQQWYGPLRALHDRHPVIVVLQDSRTARQVRAESGLTAVTIARYGRLDDILSRSQVKLALYVGHNPQNFSALRFISLLHVYLTHGDSDKGVTVSHQVRAYDFLFVSGQASIDRLRGYLMLDDPQPRCRVIGRPQLDFGEPAAPVHPGARPTVLYAPTWEGGQPSVAYGSVASHGPRLVRALLASGRFTVVYRPHPLGGVVSPAFGEADRQVRQLVQGAAAADAAAGHRIDADGPLNASFAGADLLVCDVSAVAMDWLPSGKPLLVTLPERAEVLTPRSPMLDLLPRLRVADLDGAVDLLREQLEQDPLRRARLGLVDYYLSDTAPGAATKRFVDACSEVIEIRDREWARVVAAGPAGP